MILVTKPDAPDIIQRRPFAVATLAAKADGKLDKQPRTPATLKPAETNDIDTLGTYAEAVEAIEDGRAKVAGPVLKRDGIICLDLDRAIDADTGTITDGALWIISLFPGVLITRSVSGTGLHIWIKAKAPPGMKEACADLWTGPDKTGQKVEVLVEKFVAEFWDVFQQGDILPVQNELNAIYAELKSKATTAPTMAPSAAHINGNGHMNGNGFGAPSGDIDRRFLMGKLRKFTADMNAATDGERHALRYNRARTAAGYLHTGHITEADIWEALAVNFGADRANAEKTIRDAIAEGAANPLPYQRDETPFTPAPRVFLNGKAAGAIGGAMNGSAASGAQPEPEAQATEVPPIFSNTDVGNADRLIWQNGHELRFCYQSKKWLVWDGARWKWDDDGETERRAEQTAQSIAREVTAEPNEKKREELAKHWAKTLSSKGINAMVERARSKVAVKIELLDSDPWLLNCENGTLDLRTGELAAHHRPSLITKLAPVAFDADAKCPVWCDFLMRIMDYRADLVNFLHRAIGYSLTGVGTEQCMFILHGSGSNGKSTLLSALAMLLNDYAMQTPAETLMAKKEEGVRNDLARLRGARFVSAIETSEGRRLDESLIKQLTGGDKIAARFLFQEFFEFTPQFKTFLSTNHKPTVKGTDHAIWRRLHLIPFDVQFWDADKGQSGEESLRMDKTLGDKIAAELPGILAWAVEGCLIWQKDGLPAPAEVKEATSTYREEMDSLGEFLAECCIEFPNAACLARDLYAKYGRWCEDAGEYKLSQRALGLRLQDRGFKPHKGTAGIREWIGIKISEFGGAP